MADIEPRYTAAQFEKALLRLGSQVTESHREMLGAHAAARGRRLSAVELGEVVGRTSGQREFTQSVYGRLGHLLADALGYRGHPGVWTRLIGSDRRNSDGDVEWRMHPELAKAVRRLGWTRKPGTQRSPPWSEEELVLALELYLNEGLLDDSHPKVVQLSRTLNELDVHRDRPDASRFRNPNGVELKLANFVALDPSDPRKGVSSVGKRDREVWERYSHDEDALADVAAEIRAGMKVTGRAASPSKREVLEVPVEGLHTEAFDVKMPVGQRTGVRREQVLVLAFNEWLMARGHKTSGRRYRVPGVGDLVCDLFDSTDRVLYEAKANVRRESIRMAIGQLLDYARLESERPRLAVLLPRQPHDDLISLLASQAIGVVWREADTFVVR